MIEMQRDGDIIDFKSGFYEVNQILVASILARTCGNLQNQRRLEFASSIRNALNDLHVVDVESAAMAYPPS